MHTPNVALAIVRQSAALMGATDLHRFAAARTGPDGRLALIDYDLDDLMVRAQILSGHCTCLVAAVTGIPVGPSVLRRVAASFGVSARDVFALEMFSHITQIADAELGRVVALHGQPGTTAERAVA